MYQQYDISLLFPKVRRILRSQAHVPFSPWWKCYLCAMQATLRDCPSCGRFRQESERLPLTLVHLLMNADRNTPVTQEMEKQRGVLPEGLSRGYITLTFLSRG